jgi:tetratricopeptide (TPR) repeat protein
MRGAVVALVVLWATPVIAEPTRWAKIRDPELGAERRLRQKIEERLLDHQRDRTSTFAETLFAEDAQLKKARIELEDAKVTTSTSVVLKLLYGRIMFALEQWDAARAMFRQVAATPPTGMTPECSASPRRGWCAGLPDALRSDVLNDLAITEARLGGQSVEVVTYESAIAFEPMPSARSTMLANQSEGFMVAGDVERAIEGYRGAIETLSVADQRMGFLASPTTWWSLGVALDRSGDFGGALEAIGRARAYDPRDQMLSGEGWFFVPPYDEAYFKALGHWQAAQRSDVLEQKVAEMEMSVRAWRRYVDAAPPADHWLAVAKRRLERAEREYAALQKTAATPTPLSP